MEPTITRPAGLAVGVYRAAIRHALAAVMAILLAIMVLQVFFRYGLNASLIWAEEICRYLLIWASFLACGIAYARGEIHWSVSPQYGLSETATAANGDRLFE